MLIHKDEIDNGDLPNFLFLIYSTVGLSTYFLIKKILEKSLKMKTFQNALQRPAVFQYGKFYKVL